MQDPASCTPFLIQERSTATARQAPGCGNRRFTESDNSGRSISEKYCIMGRNCKRREQVGGTALCEASVQGTDLTFPSLRVSVVKDVNRLVAQIHLHVCLSGIYFF